MSIAAHRVPRAVATPVLMTLTFPVSLGISATSLLLPTAAGALGVSLGAATWLLTLYGWGMALVMPFAAYVGDRFGRRTMLRAGGAASAAGAVLILCGPWLPLIGAGRVLLAAGAGVMVVSAMNVARAFTRPVRRQRALGLISAGIGVSGALGPLAGALVADASSWRVALALPALSLVSLPLVSRVLSDEPAAGVGGLGFARVLRDRRFLASVVLVLALTTVYFGLVYAAPLLLGESTGWSRSEVGAVLVVPGLVGAGLSWASAGAVLRFGARRVAIVLALLATFAAASAGLWGGVPPVLAAAGAAAFASAAGQGVLVGSATSTLPESARTSGVGLVNFAFQFGSVVGPAALSVLAPAAGLGWGLLAVASVPPAALVLTGFAVTLGGRNRTV
ncbi:MFS transporter [Phytomonospora sp. NPDC050363]|uniref:MFS transporter n=1 Tax=Phytomonospora sp. NPDC050363 TaxID=3155642 RepID=UPI0033DD3087